MAISILEYWREISATITGIALFIGGRKSAKLLEKKQHTDAVSSMQQTYDLFLVHYEKQYAMMQKQYEEMLISNKELSKRFNKLQDQFLSLQLSYAKEVENSQNWEKLHRELEKKYEELEKLYEKLKADFEKHRKLNKI